MKARNKSHMVCHGQYLLFLIVSPSLSSFLLSSGGENILINWWYNEINKFNFQIPDSVDGAGGGCFQAPRKCRCQSSLQSVRNECSIMCISDRNIERYEGMSIFVKEFSYRVYEEYVECYVQGPMKYVPWIQAHLKRYSRKKFVSKYNRTKNKRYTKQKPRKDLLMFFYWICRPLCWQCHMSVSYSVWHVSRLFLSVLIRCQSRTFFGHQPFNWVAGALLSFFSSKSFVILLSTRAVSLHLMDQKGGQWAVRMNRRRRRWRGALDHSQGVNVCPRGDWGTLNRKQIEC